MINIRDKVKVNIMPTVTTDMKDMNRILKVMSVTNMKATNMKATAVKATAVKGMIIPAIIR